MINVALLTRNSRLILIALLAAFALPGARAHSKPCRRRRLRPSITVSTHLVLAIPAPATPIRPA